MDKVPAVSRGVGDSLGSANCFHLYDSMQILLQVYIQQRKSTISIVLAENYLESSLCTQNLQIGIEPLNTGNVCLRRRVLRFL